MPDFIIWIPNTLILCFRVSTKYKVSTKSTKTEHKIQSILCSVFPDCWKSAIVTPVLKSNKNFSLSNFRPISVLSVFSKILEQVVFDQIVDHFHKHSLFSPKQSGFRENFVMVFLLKMYYYMLLTLVIQLLIMASMLVLCS